MIVVSKLFTFFSAFSAAICNCSLLQGVGQYVAVFGERLRCCVTGVADVADCHAVLCYVGLQGTSNIFVLVHRTV